MDKIEVFRRPRFGSLDSKQIKRELKDEFNEIKDQLEDHLLSINENTTEIQANHGFINHVNQKVDKLAERLDYIQLLLGKLVNKNSVKEDKSFAVQPLTAQEKRVFMILYTIEEPLNYSVLSMRLNMVESLVSQYLLNLTEKGVPIEKEFKHGKPYVKLNKEFRDYQAKNNILKIDQTTLNFV